MAKYIDLNTSFRQSLNNNDCVLTDLNVIKKNLERLFQTTKGTIPFNRNYGSSLYNLLFENNVEPSDIRTFLYMDITEFEPRVNLNPADIDITKKDLYTYIVTCTFTVPSLNNISSTVQSVITNG